MYCRQNRISKADFFGLTSPNRMFWGIGTVWGIVALPGLTAISLTNVPFACGAWQVYSLTVSLCYIPEANGTVEPSGNGVVKADGEGPPRAF